MRIADDGSIKINSNDMTRVMRSFGEADFINQIKQASQVFSTSEYSSGFSIDGNESSQAQYLTGGSPVVFPYRFGGIFSVFNTSHFSSMFFSRGYSAHLPERLGASFEFTPAYRFKPGVEGAVNIGMLSSSLTLRGGIADRVAIGVSGRMSYIDQIYGKLFERSGSNIKYNFYDLNADMAVRLSDSDCIKAGLLKSTDKLGYDDSNYSLDTRIHWDNNIYKVSYSHKGEMNIEGIIYRSYFQNMLHLEMPQFELRGPSAFTTNGLNYQIGQVKDKGKLAEWSSGVRLSYDLSQPQWAILEMTSDIDAADRSSTSISQILYNVALFSKGSWWLMPEKLKLTGETSVGLYGSKMKSSGKSYRHLLITPNINLLFYLTDGVISFSTGFQQQPVHQVGFSELGLSSNFWIGACERAPMQSSFSLSARAVHRLPWWNLKIEGSVYWKRLWNQAEYRGVVMEVIDPDYDPFSHLIISDGYNYGFSVELSRLFGNVTGNIGYEFVDGWRHLPSDAHKSWHSLNSEGSAIRCNIIWHEGRHWTLSTTWRIASGRRYTPVESIYAIGGNIAMVYGERNSARLPSYQRLDLGVTYHLVTGTNHRLRHAINASILNAYGHRNVEMQYFVLNSKEGTYSLKRLNSLYRFLPSLSYSIEF